MNTAILKNGDCLELIKELNDCSIDAIITSPPYNFDLEYGEYSDNKQWTEYFEWLDSLWRDCYRVLKVGGRLIVNIQPRWKFCGKRITITVAIVHGVVLPAHQVLI